jgi:hypothetical protein
MYPFKLPSRLNRIQLVGFWLAFKLEKEKISDVLCCALGRLEFEKESMVLEWKKMEDDFRKVQSKGSQLQSEVEGLKREVQRLQMKEASSSLPPETSEVA